MTQKILDILELTQQLQCTYPRAGVLKLGAMDPLGVGRQAQRDP